MPEEVSRTHRPFAFTYDEQCPARNKQFTVQTFFSERTRALRKPGALCSLWSLGDVGCGGKQGGVICRGMGVEPDNGEVPWKPENECGDDKPQAAPVEGRLWDEGKVNCNACLRSFQFFANHILMPTCLLHEPENTSWQCPVLYGILLS